MKSVNCVASYCGRCRFYTPTGRRGGDCTQLGVPVKANWKACQLACSPFETESFNTSNFLPNFNPFPPEILTSKALAEFDLPETCPSPQSLDEKGRQPRTIQTTATST